MKIYLIHLGMLYLANYAAGQEQQIAQTTFAVEGKEVTIPCAVPGTSTFVKWAFHRNGTNFDVDAAQVYPPNLPSIFAPFNSPKERSSIVQGSFIIHQIRESEEGEYWCEISQLNVPTIKSPKYPVHVYVTPQKPVVTSLANNTLTEYKGTPVARCTSQGGKPGSTLTWLNGSEPILGEKAIVKKNAFKNYLYDADLDLVLANPTRYDHKRTFHCRIEHPSYDEPKYLNYSVLVMYHPVNIRVWANLTSKYVFCEAESYPKPTYHWTMPGGLTGFTTPSLYVPDLFDLPGGERFECVAYNGLSPNASIRVLVDDIRYPDGKPGFEWWIWAAIGGGALVLIVILIITIYCCKCRNTEKSESAVTYQKATKKKLDNYSSKPQHPTTLPLSDRRASREDSFDSRTPSPENEHKQAILGGYGDQVAIVPREELRRSREHLYDGGRSDLRRSQENLYDEDRANMRASREQLDMVASHISTLNKSWDQLSKSREALNTAQDELQNMNYNLGRSREQLYHSREALNRDNDQNYPYIDDDTRQGYNYQRDEQDGRRQPPPAYDYDSYRQSERGYGSYRDGPQYDENQRYDERDQREYDRDQRGYAGDDRYNDYRQEDYQYDDRYRDNNQGGYDQYYNDNQSSRMI